MDTFVQPGDVLEFTAPSGGVVTGVPKQIGQILVIPAVTAAINVRFNGSVAGVFSVPKIGSQAWTEGAVVFWDSGNGRFTTSGAGNLQAGIAVVAVGSGATETTGVVRLDGVGRESGT